jgi:hypothetical protein
VEKSSNNTFPFLEGEVTITNEKISSIFKNKNFEPLLESGNLKYITAQDFFSFSGKNESLRIGVVTGRLSTLLGYCFTDGEIIKSFIQLLFHLIHLSYTSKIITCACRKLYCRTQQKVWLLLAKMTAYVFKDLKL